MAMAGGSLAQAKRRSSSDTDSSRARNVITINGMSLELNAVEPTQQELLVEIAKKRTVNKTIPQKLKDIADPIVKERALIITTANGQVNESVATKLEDSTPGTTPKTLSGSALAACLLAMHSAFELCIDKQQRPSRCVTKAHDSLDEVVKTAISNFQMDKQEGSSCCFPTLTHSQQQRKCKQDGCVPSDPAHQRCIACGHMHIDEPNSNKDLQQKHLQEMREFERKKQAAKDDAAKNKSAPKRITAPKLVQACQQCHCSQLCCVSVGTVAGSSCPIKCRKNCDTSWGADVSGTCACPICKCTCDLAFAHDAAQALRTRQLLQSHKHQRQKEIDVQKSRSAFTSLSQDATTTAAQATLDSGKKLSVQTVQQMAGTASAQSVAANFDPALHHGFLRTIRSEIGQPTTKVQLPIPLTDASGNFTADIDTRNASGRKATHGKSNNRLTEGEGTVPTREGATSHPHKDAHEIGSHCIGDGTLNEEDAVKRATEESLGTFSKHDGDMARAMKASVDGQATDIDSDGAMPPPTRKPSSKQVVYLLSPMPATTTPTASGESDCAKRAQKRAFQRSTETTELLDTDDPTALPVHVASSPCASKVFNELADPRGRPAVTSYLNHCVEAHPLASGQEGHEAASNFMRDLDGKPKKRRSKNKKRRS